MTYTRKGKRMAAGPFGLFTWGLRAAGKTSHGGVVRQLHELKGTVEVVMVDQLQGWCDTGRAEEGHITMNHSTSPRQNLNIER